MISEQLLARFDIQGTITGRFHAKAPTANGEPTYNDGVPLHLEETGERTIEGDEFQRSKKRHPV